METILVLAPVLAPIFVVFVSWLAVLKLGFSSKSLGIRTTRPRRKQVESQIGQMRNSGAWSLRLEALFCSLGGLVAVPAVAGTYYFLTTGEVWGLVGGIIVGVVAFTPWFFAAGRLGLWHIWRDVFSQRITMTGRVSKHWIETTERVSASGRSMVYPRQHGVTVKDQPFKVSQKIHDWVSKDDEVVISYWPHSKRVATVEMISRASTIKERPKDVYLSLLSELEAEGGFVTFQHQDNENSWVQILLFDEETRVNFSYPYDEDPNRLISKRSISFPTGYDLFEWERRVNATFAGPRCPHSELADTIDALFIKLLGSRPDYVVEGRVEES